MFKWQVFHTDTRDELLASVFGAAARVRELKISSDEKHAILAHESWSALRLTVGFSNILYEM